MRRVLMFGAVEGTPRASGAADGDRVRRCCRSCSHFDNRAATVEAALPGLMSFGSAASAVRSSDGLCRLHARYLSADRWCVRHEVAANVARMSGIS
jgi:hypothetical protein